MIYYIIIIGNWLSNSKQAAVVVVVVGKAVYLWKEVYMLVHKEPSNTMGFTFQLVMIKLFVAVMNQEKKGSN